MLKLVIFDIDGTLTPQRSSSTADEAVVPLPGRRERLAALTADGVVIAVASNQGGVRPGRPGGRMTWGTVLRRMRQLRRIFPEISAVKFAVVTGPRKKPEPGMLVELMREFGVTPDETLFVGDAESDREAAKRAECHFAWAEEFFRGS